MTCTPSPILVALLTSAVIGPGSGRTGASLAALVALAAAVAGGLALARSRDGRTRADAALVLAPIALVLAGLHLATNAGAIGTGHGRAGALVALVLGSIGLLLGALARTRSRRTE